MQKIFIKNNLSFSFPQSLNTIQTEVLLQTIHLKRHLETEREEHLDEEGNSNTNSYQ